MLRGMTNKTSYVIHRQEAQIGGILQAIFYSVRVSQSPHAEPFSFHQLAFHNAVYYLTLVSAFSSANLEGFEGGTLRQVGVIMPDISLVRSAKVAGHSFPLSSSRPDDLVDFQKSPVTFEYMTYS